MVEGWNLGRYSHDGLGFPPGCWIIWSAIYNPGGPYPASYWSLFVFFFPRLLWNGFRKFQDFFHSKIRASTQSCAISWIMVDGFERLFSSDQLGGCPKWRADFGADMLNWCVFALTLTWLICLYKELERKQTSNTRFFFLRVANLADMLYRCFLWTTTSNPNTY